MSFYWYFGSSQSGQTFDGYFPPADVATVPLGWKFQSFSRLDAKSNVTAGSWAATSTMQCQGLWLPGGVPVSKMAWMSGTTAASSPTHQWGVLMDSVMKVLAVTTDKTTTAITASTLIGSTGTWTWNSVLGGGTTYTTGYTGLYYIGLVVTASTTAPSLLGFSDAAGACNALAPAIAGTSTTGLAATLPAVAAYQTAITGTATQFYCLVG